MSNTALPFLPVTRSEPATDAGPNCALSTGSAGWVPISTPPPVEVPVALHFGWGEVRDGWLMSNGRYRTAGMPLPQDTETITHWCALPNNELRDGASRSL